MASLSFQVIELAWVNQEEDLQQVQARPYFGYGGPGGIEEFFAIQSSLSGISFRAIKDHRRDGSFDLVIEVAVPHWPLGQSYLKDQLKRALGSALLNLAEGNGKRSRKDRRRIFNISQGSLAETGACLDLAVIFYLIPQTNSQNWKAQLTHCYNQINRLP